MEEWVSMDWLLASFSPITDAVVTVFAFSIFVSNMLTLIVLTKIILLLRKRREGFETIVNLFFVCLNDTMCGLILIFYTGIHVDGTITGHLCAYTIILCLALLTTSQGNILCICFQRYLAARNIKNVTTDNQNFRSLCLLLVNVLVGVASAIVMLFQAKVRYDISGLHSPCDLLTTIGSSAITVGKTFYYVQLTTTIVADSLCLLTIIKLRRELNVIVSSDISTNSKTGHKCSQTNTGLQRLAKTKQQRVILTLFLLLVFFNVSLLPNLIVFTLFEFDIENRFFPPRFSFFFLFINSFVNPIIIMTRNKDIRIEFKQSIKNIKDKIKSCVVFR